jgi:hypothetical protein
MGGTRRKRDRIATNRIGAQREGDTQRISDRFQPNVFTWTGPGVENLFIAHEPRGLQRRTRSSWN